MFCSDDVVVCVVFCSDDVVDCVVFCPDVVVCVVDVVAGCVAP